MGQSEGTPHFQPQYVQSKPPVEYLRPLASDFLLAIGIILGMFLMWLGAVIAGGISGGYTIGNVIGAFGNFIAISALFLGAILRVDLDKLVRFGFILAAAILVAGVGFWPF